jgi:hypothetical protein
MGRVDVPDLPDFYQDKFELDGKIYTPFPPAPALFLAPIVNFFPDITQQEVSIIVGALNAVLVFILLSKFTSTQNSFLLTLFFSFGTVAFWSSMVGTTWYFAHNVAVLFLLLSLISFKERRDFLSGIFFAIAVLCRYPILVGGIFYALELVKERKRLFLFLAGAFLAIPTQFLYDYLRFGSFFETGYVKVYESYIHGSYPFTFMQLINPTAPYFGYMDLRNIPLHLFTFLLYPPIIDQSLRVTPSPYGMGIIFTTPLLLLALKPLFTSSLERNLFIGALAIALTEFMHYAQGWVQFGYRFSLDFMPFLLIILALRFRSTAKQLMLLAISVFANTWGALWAIKLGW